jgi:uncharacterized membrane protein
MSADLFVFLAVGLMGIAAYSTRAAGIWVMGRVRLGPFADAFLRATPGAVLMALLAPMLAQGGPAEWAGASVTLLVTMRTRNLLLATALGTGVVWALRTF